MSARDVTPTKHLYRVIDYDGFVWDTFSSEALALEYIGWATARLPEATVDQLALRVQSAPLYEITGDWEDING